MRGNIKAQLKTSYTNKAFRLNNSNNNCFKNCRVVLNYGK